jgi:hypothetical protein
MSAITKVTGKKPTEQVHENGLDENTSTSEAEASDAAATGVEKAGGKKRKVTKRR